MRQDICRGLKRSVSLCTFRQQIDKYRREAEDAKNRLYEYEADAQRIQQETALENEKVAKPPFPSKQTS